MAFYHDEDNFKTCLQRVSSFNEKFHDLLLSAETRRCSTSDLQSSISHAKGIERNLLKISLVGTKSGMYSNELKAVLYILIDTLPSDDLVRLSILRDEFEEQFWIRRQSYILMTTTPH